MRKQMVSVRCTGAALCRSTGLLQPNYFLLFLCLSRLKTMTTNSQGKDYNDNKKSSSSYNVALVISNFFILNYNERLHPIIFHFTQLLERYNLFFMTMLLDV